MRNRYYSKRHKLSKKNIASLTKKKLIKFIKTLTRKAGKSVKKFRKQKFNSMFFIWQYHFATYVCFFVSTNDKFDGLYFSITLGTFFFIALNCLKKTLEVYES